MEPEDLPHVPDRIADAASWAAVGVFLLATAGTAYVDGIGLYTLPVWVTPLSAIGLGLAGFWALMRHAGASRAARVSTNGYELAFASEIAARDRLGFARHAAVLMASLPPEQGVRAVLDESIDRFQVEAAAMVGDDVAIATAEGVDPSDAQSGVLSVALETVRAGRSVAQDLDDDGAHALTVPMRVRGQLANVMVLWRRGAGFGPDDLDGLSLLARIVELSMENQALLSSVRDQLDGTIGMMIGLVEQRLPNYGAYSERVSQYAAAVGRRRGMADDELEDLRIAGMLHDVGMLEVPESILNTPRRLTLEEQVELRGHPEHGAELTRVANFSPRVQATIRSHHERVDGTGYPDGLRGDDIPLASRILSVCDAFVAMVSERAHRAAMTPDEAIASLRADAGMQFDARVVEEFIEAHAAAATGSSVGARPAAAASVLGA